LNFFKLICFIPLVKNAVTRDKGGKPCQRAVNC
jgi:hypothetical protein